MIPQPATLSRRLRHSRGILARAVAALWLVLHVFTVAGLPVVDGLADHPDAVVAHIEDADGGNCPASHDDSCDLCQVAHGLRALAAAPAGYGLPVVERRAPAPHGVLTHPGAFAFLDGNSSRAPPVLG